jgi:hypothetical protein
MPAAGSLARQASATVLRHKGWIVAAIVVFFGLPVGGLAIAWFTHRDEEAERMYAALEWRMESKNEQEFIAARAELEQFLRRFPDHAKAHQVRLWLDRADRAFFAQDRLDGIAKDAQLAGDYEEQGKLDAAMRVWGDVFRIAREIDHPDADHWRRLADTHRDDLQEAFRLGDSLRDILDRERNLKTKQKGGSEYEEVALEAMRAELDGRSADARRTWERLRRQLDADFAPRPWRLVVAGKLRDLNDKAAK